VIHPSKLENLIEESMDNCKSPVNRVTESIDDFKVGDVVEITLTDDKLHPGYKFQVLIAAVLSIPNDLDNSVDKELHFDLSGFTLDGDKRGNNWWVEKSYWRSEMDFCIAYEIDEDGGKYKDFECFRGTIRKISIDGTEELKAKLDAANRKIRVLEAGGLADKFSVVGG
jgi:hypothetical protein